MVFCEMAFVAVTIQRIDTRPFAEYFLLIAIGRTVLEPVLILLRRWILKGKVSEALVHYLFIIISVSLFTLTKVNYHETRVAL